MVKLSKSEEELMNILWRLKKAFMKDILSAYGDPKPKTTTVATLLNRMQKKGYVSYEMHGSVRAYEPLVPKSTYFKTHLNELIEKHFDNSTTQFASFFAEEIDMTPQQLRELRAIIDEQLKEEEK